jgi:3-dehydroquinate synthase
LIEVKHSAGSYPIHFERIHMEDGFVITDQNVQKILTPPNALVLPAGEQTKSLIWLERIAAWLSENGASRNSTLVALGGGVIGDLVGFAAATYMRGIRYVQIPTTLLAQVDSSVGGKVAVDIPQGKNLVGAFYPPERVTIDTSVLDHLSPRQLRNGMAEVWKYAFIMDAPLAEELRKGIARDEMVRRCVQHKADIVGEDEFETKGLRAILNFGHTIGHAIEQVTGYRSFLHGEAISIGMVAESLLGENLGITRKGTTDMVRESLSNQGLPIHWEGLKRSEPLVLAMKRDKKATDGRLAFSLLTQIGGCKLVENVDQQEVVRALEML